MRFCDASIARRIIACGMGFVIAVQLPNTAHCQNRVVGYYPMWASGTLSPKAINFNNLTHIAHAFAWPNPDGSLAFDNPVADTGLINTTHRAGRKIVLSLGGAGSTQTTNYSIVAADSNLRKTFIANVASYLTVNHYDGADLDWEGPATVSDKTNEVLLVRGMRNAFNAANPSFLLTMAIGADSWSGQWRDYTSLKAYVDWFGDMTYDFYGSWSSTTGHNAPLYAPPGNYAGSIDQSIAYLASTRGIPRSQIVLGLPFYGKQFNGTAALYAAYSGETDLSYSNIVATTKSGWTYNWDNVSKVPYLTNTTLPAFITFDDSTSLSNKCVYAKSSNLGGVMIWEITQDVIGQTQPLLDAIGIAMGLTSDIAQNLNETLPREFELSQNYPNPFNPTTGIRFQVPGASNVKLAVYDLLGREVAVLVNETKARGSYESQFNASGLSSGVYFYRLQAIPISGGRSRSFEETKRMLVLR